MKKSTIEIQNLSTGFRLSAGKVRRLHHGLNLDLKQGELVCILGPNGSGKSTLLRTLLGFEKPLDGEVLIDQKPIDRITIREMARFVSVVLTDKIDDFYLTAFEVALTGRYPYGSITGKVSAEDKTAVETTFEKLGVHQLLDSVFYKLSDGEKQRVMIGRAIIQDTPFIFLDEPVAFVDSPGKVGIMHQIKGLTKTFDKGVLMATHDLESALDFADRLWLLGMNDDFEEGIPEKLVSSGSLNRFFDSEKVTFDQGTKRFVMRN